jgi:hypothetical protein
MGIFGEIFLGSLAKFRKATVNFVMSVCFFQVETARPSLGGIP